jgi:high-affinity iron transporter
VDLGFIFKATSIVFRESFEAMLIYGIIISFIKREDSLKSNIKIARWGFFGGVLASVLFGLLLAGSVPLISPEFFSKLEIAVIFTGSIFMLYMVFWMAENSRNLKSNLEKSLSKANLEKGFLSIFLVVFVSVFREGVETVVYLYSLALENNSAVQIVSIASSLFLGVSMAYVIYFLITKTSKTLSLKTVFKVTSIFLLFSSSSLMASGIDKLFAADVLSQFSNSVFAISVPEFFKSTIYFFEGMSGFRFEPSILHTISFLGFWLLVIYKDPIGLKLLKSDKQK